MGRINTVNHILFQMLRGEPPGSFETVILPEFTQLLIRHRLLDNIEEYQSIFPEEYVNDLKTKIKEQTLRSLFLTHELIQIHDSFTNIELDFILLKGPGLSVQLYDSVGKRPFNDLDILVSQSDFLTVKNMFLSMGYKILYPSITDQNKYHYYFKHKRDIGFVNQSTGTNVELHYGINAHRLIPVNFETVFLNDLTGVRILDRHFLVLRQEINFIYLCFHGAHHLFFRLFWLKDISRALDTWRLDHAEIIIQSRKFGLERLLGISLILVSELFGNKIPSEYDEITANPIIRKLKDICLLRIIGPEVETRRLKLQKHYYFLMLKPGLSYKLYVIASIFHRWYIRKFLGGH